MPFEERIALIKAIEDQRNSKVITYVTSLRPGATGSIADDQIRIFLDQVSLLPERKIPKLDLFLVSNGGSSIVPWRLVALFREFAEQFNVIIPFRAYSAASILALGANEIVMHPFAEMGPIDPTVTNEFNPKDPQTQRLMGISVEDVTAYISFVKNTVGITHEDELIEAVKILAEKVHPLALGNVERFLSQSRMVAKKIMSTHMDDSQQHRINEIVENMASKLYFHGHPINRQEAATDLGLKVISDLQPALETAIWELYKLYETEMQMDVEHNPVADLNSLRRSGPDPAILAETHTVHQELAQKMQDLQSLMQAQPPDPIAISDLQNALQTLQNRLSELDQKSKTVEKQYDQIWAAIESTRRSSLYKSTKIITMMTSDKPFEVFFREDDLSKGWHHYQVEAV